MESVFAVLERLPQKLAFDIFRRLDQLAEFPEMGSPLGPRFPRLEGFRQIIYRRQIRMIYEFDESDQTVYVLLIQDCRQKIPTPRDLKRTEDIDNDSPFE